MRRKHGGWESGAGMLNQKRRDAAISSVQRKWACRDKDKLRGRRRLEAGATILRNEGGGRKSKPSDGERE